jgi:hypothetical protein
MRLDFNFSGLEELLAATQKLARLHPENTRKVRAINLAAAKKGLSPYKSAIKRGAEVRVRRTGPSSPRYEGGKSGPAQDIKSGTLWRSVRVIQPKNGTNVWIGPRSTATFQKKGLKQVNRADAWFSEIVDQGRERYGSGKNKGFADKAISRARRVIEPELRKQHKAFILKAWK